MEILTPNHSAAFVQPPARPSPADTVCTCPADGYHDNLTACMEQQDKTRSLAPLRCVGDGRCLHVKCFRTPAKETCTNQRTPGGGVSIHPRIEDWLIDAQYYRRCRQRLGSAPRALPKARSEDTTSGRVQDGLGSVPRALPKVRSGRV